MRVSPRFPVTLLVLLWEILNGSQGTASHVNTLVQAEFPGPLPKHVAVNEFPEVDVYPLSQVTVIESPVLAEKALTAELLIDRRSQATASQETESNEN